MKDAILSYLHNRYAPQAILLYGSYADGSHNAHSDFDALLIADGPAVHDTSAVDGTLLDVFVYPPETFAGDFDPLDYAQLFDAVIVLDTYGEGARLKQRVLDCLAEQPWKTAAELQQEVAWCRKMALRATRGDAEGLYRAHWLLVDSLEIYMDLRRQRYHGPKKALRRLAQQFPADFACYEAALQSFSPDALSAWVQVLEELMSRQKN